MQEGDILFEMETDKAMMEVEAPGSGVIRDLAQITDEPIAVGTPVAWIDPDALTPRVNHRAELASNRGIASRRNRHEPGIASQLRRRSSAGGRRLRRRARPRAQDVKGKLVLYTSQPERDAAQTVAAFKQRHPGVEVEVFRSGTTEVMGKLAAEFSAGQPKPDVLLIADAATMESLKKDGRLLPYPRGEGRRPRRRARTMPTGRISARS